MKSTPWVRPEPFARIAPHSSSVTPGYTVDSYTTTSPFLSTLLTVSLAFTTGVKSGRLSTSTGVGTATTKKVACLSASRFDVIVSAVPRSSSLETSPVRSTPLLREATFSSLMSKPTVPGNRLAKANATGRPT